MMHAVIRLRGDISIKPDIKKTLHLLRLHKVNHCVLVTSNPVNEGMLKKVKDYVTWGEIKPEVLARLIVTRGRLAGNRPIRPDYIKEATEHDSLVTFAGAIVDGKDVYISLENVKPVFRLHPPLHGHEGVKRSFKAGGALGYRGEDINALISKMLGPEPKEKTRKKAKKEQTKVPPAPAKKAPVKKKSSAKKKVPPKKEAPPKKETVKKTSAPKKGPTKKPTAKKEGASKKEAAKKPAKKTTAKREVKK